MNPPANVPTQEGLTSEIVWGRSPRLDAEDHKRNVRHQAPLARRAGASCAFGSPIFIWRDSDRWGLGCTSPGLLHPHRQPMQLDYLFQGRQECP